MDRWIRHIDLKSMTLEWDITNLMLKLTEYTTTRWFILITTIIHKCIHNNIWAMNQSLMVISKQKNSVSIHLTTDIKSLSHLQVLSMDIQWDYPWEECHNSQFHSHTWWILTINRFAGIVLKWHLDMLHHVMEDSRLLLTPKMAFITCLRKKLFIANT